MTTYAYQPTTVPVGAGTPLFDHVCAVLQANPLGGPIPPKPRTVPKRDEQGRFVAQSTEEG